MSPLPPPLTVTSASAFSARTLCDNLRRERDRAVSELAEALRSLDDTRKQKNDVSRELKELKYVGVGACLRGACVWEPGGPSPVRAGLPCMPARLAVTSLCLTLSVCRMGLNATSMLRGNEKFLEHHRRRRPVGEHAEVGRHCVQRHAGRLLFLGSLFGDRQASTVHPFIPFLPHSFTSSTRLY